MGHGRDAGQRLTAKTEAGHAFQVFQCPDLAGGVTGKCEREFGLADATAVVGNTDLLHAAFAELDRYFAGTRIEAVLEQFLEGRGGPVDDFSRRNLADQQVGQYADGGHQVASEADTGL